MFKVISVFGGDSNVGTSIIAQSMAEIAAGKGERVLFIEASDKALGSYIEFDDEGRDSDQELPCIDDILKGKDPASCILSAGSFSVVLGGRAVKQESFRKNFMYKLVQAVSDSYDRIVIDAGSNAGSNLSISALLASERRFFIVRQNPKCIERFKKTAEEVLIPEDLYKKGDKIIINALRKNKLLYSKEQVESSLLRNTYSLPYIRDGLRCEYTKESLLWDASFKKELTKIMNETL